MTRKLDHSWCRDSRLLLFVSCVACSNTAAWAQEAAASVPSQAQAEPAAAPAQPESDAPGTIVVIGDRAIIASLKDLPVEQEYDEDAVGSYSAGSVGEVIDAIREENGDDDPTILVNGRRVVDRSDIDSLPPEAIAKVETLPRGAAQRVGGAAGQRAYNVVLKSQVRTAILTASDEIATDGGWSNLRGEAQLTSISGQNRLNLALRAGQSGTVLESERPFVLRAEPNAYALLGNVLPASGSGQVSPALSAIAGTPVLTVALPAGLTTPTLAALVPGANQLNPSSQAAFRSLRGASRPIDLSLSGNRQLSEQLSLSFNARAGWTRNENLSGLPRARVTVPANNPFSPFGVPVSLSLEDGTRPLVGLSTGDNQSLSATLNGLFGDWRGSLNARFDRRRNVSRYPFAGQLVLPAGANPFDGTLASQIPITTNASSSTSRTGALQFDASGPLLEGWAGPIEARMNAGAVWDGYRGESTSSGSRALDTHQYLAGGGFTIPLTGREPALLSALGETDVSVDGTWIDLGAFGSLERKSFAFNWQPSPLFRLSAAVSTDQNAISPSLLSAPVTRIDNVPYFDPLTGQTVEITTLFGGFAALLPEERRERRIAATLSPWKAMNLIFDADYLVEDVRNQLGSLPEPSPAVLAAFPERFVRDATGTLVLVDNSSVNFARQRNERARFGLRYTLPLGAPPPPPKRVKGQPVRRTPQTKLQVAINHSVLLESTTVIRPGLPTVDLVDGGAIGVGGTQPRTSTNANFALTRGGSGARLQFQRRGESLLVYGTTAAPQLLTYRPLTRMDFKFYTDFRELLPDSRLAKGARFTISVDNVFNRRQLVTAPDGTIPQAFQQIRRDPLGRTVMAELRKSF